MHTPAVSRVGPRFIGTLCCVDILTPDFCPTLVCSYVEELHLAKRGITHLTDDMEAFESLEVRDGVTPTNHQTRLSA